MSMFEGPWTPSNKEIRTPPKPEKPLHEEPHYALRIRGPRPNTPGKYVLILYGRPTPFGMYDGQVFMVDQMEVFPGEKIRRAYVESGRGSLSLVAEFPSEDAFLLFSREWADVVEVPCTHKARPDGSFEDEDEGPSPVSRNTYL